LLSRSRLNQLRAVCSTALHEGSPYARQLLGDYGFAAGKIETAAIIVRVVWVLGASLLAEGKLVHGTQPSGNNASLQASGTTDLERTLAVRWVAVTLPIARVKTLTIDRVELAVAGDIQGTRAGVIPGRARGSSFIGAAGRAAAETARAGATAGEHWGASTAVV